MDTLDELYSTIIGAMTGTGVCGEAEAKEALNRLLEGHHCRSCDDHACEEDE